MFTYQATGQTYFNFNESMVSMFVLKAHVYKSNRNTICISKFLEYSFKFIHNNNAIHRKSELYR